VMKFGASQPVRRKEDARFLTGTGRYVDDISLPGQAHLAIVRSPHAHADIRSIDIAAAAGAPGVLAVYTGADLEADGLGHLPCNVTIKNKDGSARAETPRPALAVGRVRHVGEPVAAVVAETPAAARDAAELVAVDYAPLAAVADVRDAMAAEAPRLFDDVPGNVCFDWAAYDKEATEAAFAEADRVVTIEVVNNRVVVNALEPRAAIAAYDPDTDRYTLYTGTQGTLSVRRVLARQVLKVPEDRVRVITPDVGGGFGAKLFLYPEYVVAVYAARRLGRPVKWVAERGESFVSDNHGRSHVTRGELALSSDGTFLALRTHTYADLGAYLSPAGPLIPTYAHVRALPGPYRFRAVYCEVTGVLTNTVPVDAYRGAGRPEATYLVERLVEAAAKALGLAPDEIRRRNFVAPDEMPYRTASGLVYDSGEFAEILERAKRRADWEGFDKRRAAALERGRRAGIGIGFYVEVTGGAPDEAAQIVFNDDDTIDVFVGTLSTGQGHETAFAQIVAERLGVSLDAVRIRQGDSDAIGSGGGTGGSRSLHAEGGAILDGVAKVIDKGRRVAANVLEAAVEDVEFADGRFAVAGTDVAIDILALARAARDPRHLPAGEEPGLDAAGAFSADVNTFPNGCHVCEVEVDEETGAVAVTRYTVVDDFGAVVNPMLVMGQVHGGVAQGLGQALLERTVYDRDGQLLSGSWVDYCMPRADDVPAIDFAMHGVPSPTNPLGIKGCGEAGAIGAPPAVVNALLDALAPVGVTDIDMPATPERVWRAIRAAAEGRDAAGP